MPCGCEGSMSLCRSEGRGSIPLRGAVDCRYFFCPDCGQFIAPKERYSTGERILCPNCNVGTVWCWVAGKDRFKNIKGSRGLFKECDTCKFRFVCITCYWFDVYEYFHSYDKGTPYDDQAS